MAGNFLPAGNYRPREPADAGAALDDALAAMAWAIEDEGQGPLPALDQVRSANQAASNQPVGNVIASSSRRRCRVVGWRASPGTPGTA
jgi:hypothetical protein